MSRVPRTATRRTPKQLLALAGAVILMQFSAPVCLQLFPHVFHHRPLRVLLLVACLLPITLPLLMRAYRYDWRDDKRSAR